MCLNTGTPKNINFSLETNGKLMALGVPILKQFRVSQYSQTYLKQTHKQEQNCLLKAGACLKQIRLY